MPEYNPTKKLKDLPNDELHALQFYMSKRMEENSEVLRTLRPTQEQVNSLRKLWEIEYLRDRVVALLDEVTVLGTTVL